jgi:hypothetical protein
VKRTIALFLLAALTVACSDAASPERRINPGQSAPLRTIEVSGPDDIPVDDSEIPDAFRSASLIEETKLDVGFLGKVAYAIARMRYYATHGKIFLKLTAKKGDDVVGQDTTTAYKEQLIPGWNDLVARVQVSVADTCGYRADGHASFSVWMGFLVPQSIDLFTWGRITIPLARVEEQPACPPATFTVSDTPDDEYDEDFFENFGIDTEPESEDPYDGTCQTCQLWLAFVNGYFYSYWWECSEEDPSYCEFLEAR